MLLAITTVHGYDYLIGACGDCGRVVLVRWSTWHGWICEACLLAQPYTRHYSACHRRVIRAGYARAWCDLRGEQAVEALLDRSLGSRWARLRAALETKSVLWKGETP